MTDLERYRNALDWAIDGLSDVLEHPTAKGILDIQRELVAVRSGQASPAAAYRIPEAPQRR